MNNNEQKTTLLIVDDDASNLQSLEKIFCKEGFRVFSASSGKQAVELCRNHNMDVVLTDLMMPQMSGLELMKALETLSVTAPIVLMTAYGTVETAVEAMKTGAYDFVEKPLKRGPLIKTVQKAAEKQLLLKENQSLKKELAIFRSNELIGNSSALRQAMEISAQAASSSATVLILGESGTGKELLARYVHEHSGRKGEFVAVNLAALPETIIESELFGHEKGAFTGANSKRKGRIEKADEGTLFLDEIGELSPSIQVKLLRVLQEGEYEPLGGSTQKANFRLIAATNRDLLEAVETGDFREDLYYRLHVISVTSPPLRSRKEDISLLVDHFVTKYCLKNKREILVVDPQTIEQLKAYDWPGNVRELENVMERAVVLCKKNTLSTEDLPPSIAKAEQKNEDLTFALGTPLAEIEKQVLEATLRHTHGDKQLAAQLLGISARTIYRKLDPK